MKHTSMTIAALVVTVIGAGAALPAMAEDHRGDRGPMMRFHGPGMEGRMLVHRDHDRLGPGRLGGLLALGCSERSADRLEHMLLEIEQRTDPTAEQAKLYTEFKDKALAAQADFAAACTAARPDEDERGTRDLVDRLKARLDVEVAHVDAMSNVLPAFEAFYDSLSDAQKETLEPRRFRFRDAWLDGEDSSELPAPPRPPRWSPHQS